MNPVKVRFHRKAAASNCHFPGDESISVQLWVASPSLVLSPHVTGSAAVAGFIGSPLPPEGGNHIQQVDWIPPVGLPHDDPQRAGQKCLVARCFPESGSPSSDSFFVPADQHVAQHNLCVVPVTGHDLTFEFNTVNLSLSLSPPLTPEVMLRAVLDLAPDQFVSKTVLRRLQVVTGFQQLRNKALTGGFKFDLAHFPVSQAIDHSQQGLITFPHPTPPSFEAQVGLPTRSLVPLTFLADLKDVNPGEAFIFHLIQTSTSGAAQGGLTLVALKH